ncbi:FYVE zinc finger-domain-containing protein [Dimargaris cristalligena]|uniref:FYVE zinc finger-domain-containing protein n=1 Tax=Dimargaris cristalligena TaxID=215637 RepID=A0A4P9ZY22_9FUNG|nr:FYVE zinc finger-domain-containing protein [Dimargaris cristalligena]|eukprot:RKP38635.1 FYVE zinc finger-domain-containing protein [Dimargaris cristalligena]
MSYAGLPPPPPPPPPRARRGLAALPPRRLKAGPSPTRSHTTEFLALRTATTKRLLLEENKLRQRLEKMDALHSQRPSSSHSTLLSSAASIGGLSTSSSSVTGGRLVSPSAANLRQAEQAIVKWEADGEVHACRVCREPLGGLLQRKHHCRLCGQVICYRPQCSSNLTLSMRPGRNEPATIRVCSRCTSILDRREFIVVAIRSKTHTLTAYQTIVRYRSTIDKLLPKFDELVLKLSKEADLTETHIDYQVAAKLRRDLLENLSQLDRASDQRLHNAIYQYCAQYLQQRMFSLSLLPKLLGSQTPPSSQHSVSGRSSRATLNNGPPDGPRSSSRTVRIKGLQSPPTQSSERSSPPTTPSSDSPKEYPNGGELITAAATTPSRAGESPSTADGSVVSGFLNFFSLGGLTRTTSVGSRNSASVRLAAEDLAQELDRLDVLREQRFLVEGFLQDAVQHRRLEDAKTLRASLGELEEEINGIEAVIPTI